MAYETAEDLRVECPEVDLVMFRAYSSGSAHEGLDALLRVARGERGRDRFCGRLRRVGGTAGVRPEPTPCRA